MNRTESLLLVAGKAANHAAQEAVFTDYHACKAPQTLRRNRADLLLFQEFLKAAGVTAGDFTEEPAVARHDLGLVASFVQWQLHKGYAIGSINVRLSTVKIRCELAMRAGTLEHQIKTVKGYRNKEGRNVDQTRPVARQGQRRRCRSS